MPRARILSILNLVSLFVQVFVSYGTQSGLFNSPTVGAISDKYPSLFTPAGVTFAIWGLIYTLLLVFCIRHLRIAFSSGTRAPDANSDGNASIKTTEGNLELFSIGPWFIINNLLAAAWLIAWTHEAMDAALILIGAQLVTLIIIHIRAGIYDRFASVGSRLLTQVPLSVYFGWINVAVIANVAAWLVYRHWDGSGMDYSPLTWTMIVMVMATVLTMLVIFIRRNVVFGLVLIWALYGIILRHADPAMQPIRTTAWGLMAVTAVCCLVQLVANGLWRKRQ